VNRIDKCFKCLRAEKATGFIGYIGAGDPNLDATKALSLELAKSGVDIIELGVPFSDPLADGLVNQLAAQRGLESGTTLKGVLDTVKEIRTCSEIPIVLYIYFNLIHKHGQEQFINAAAEAGVDGLLALDLPPEEADEYQTLMEHAGLASIWLIAPTTPENRIQSIAQRGTGFIYYISREGVTGMRNNVSGSLGQRIGLIREYTDLPIAVGFGVSSPEQVRQVAAECDAVVVGSAIVNQIDEHGNTPELTARVGAFVSSLTSGLKKK